MQAGAFQPGLLSEHRAPLHGDSRGLILVLECQWRPL